MARVEWVYTNNEDIRRKENVRKGGAFYNHQVMMLLAEKFDTSFSHFPKSVSGTAFERIRKNIGFMTRIRMHRPFGQIVIRDPVAVAFSRYSRQRKNVAIVHHIDGQLKGSKADFFSNRFERRIVDQDVVVVVSRFWQERLLKMGCRRVEVIHNSFDSRSFNFDDDELNNFRATYQIPNDRPVIYVGPSDPRKGGQKVFEALRDSGYFLVATGDSRADLPIFTKRFPYRDYQRLLKVSDLCVMMSEFEEGWNRAAHEALLCKTPVIGTGYGGMKELLEGSGQIVCNDPSNLPMVVKKLLDNKEDAGRKGFEFARNFDVEEFRKKWVQLVLSLERTVDEREC